MSRYETLCHMVLQLIAHLAHLYHIEIISQCTAFVKNQFRQTEPDTSNGGLGGPIGYRSNLSWVHYEANSSQCWLPTRLLLGQCCQSRSALRRGAGCKDPGAAKLGVGQIMPVSTKDKLITPSGRVGTSNRISLATYSARLRRGLTVF